MLNGAYVHLVVNHFPVVGFPICFLILLVGTLRKSRDLLQAGFVGVVLLALFAGMAWKSGGPAAHVLKNTPGVTVVWPQVGQHAEDAEKGAIVAAVLGVLGLIAGWQLCRSVETPMGLAILLVIGTLAASVWMGKVAHEGGLIRHPEIENARAAPGQ